MATEARPRRAAKIEPVTLPALAGFDPLVRDWFTQRFAAATEPQVLGWPEIRAGHDILISAPTGSGKTLAAFLLCLDRLVRAARSAGNARHATTEKSTGPRTAAGKAASSRGTSGVHLLHGLRSNKHILLDEDPAELLLLIHDHLDRFQPVGPAEENLVLRIAHDHWRLHRAFNVDCEGSQLPRQARPLRKQHRALHRPLPPPVENLPDHPHRLHP